ncbi:MAG: ATPase, T2SS/T4P/T4SS family [Myxococcota bacterium]
MGSKLGQLLSFLGRDDAIQLMFRAGQPVTLHTTRRAHPVTAANLSSKQIARFFEGTPVATMLREKSDGTGRYVLLGKTHEVEIQQRGEVLEVSVRLDDSGKRATDSKPRTREDLFTPAPTTPTPIPYASVHRAAKRAEPSSDVAAPKPAPSDSAPTVRPRGPGAYRPTVAAPEAPNGAGKTATHEARLRAALIAARGRSGRRVLVQPEVTIRTQLDGDWLNTGAAVKREDIDALVKALFDVPHLEQLASRGHASRSIDFGSAGRWNVRVRRERSGTSLVLDAVADAAPSIDALPGVLTTGPWHRGGLVLIVGRPGSGKSSTLRALLEAIATDHPTRIAVLSDTSPYPIDAARAHVTTHHVSSPRAWSSAVAGAVGQRPDVIAVDGLRVPDVAARLLHAAESGTRVLATLDAATAFDGLLRLCDLARDAGMHDVGALVASVGLAHVVCALDAHDPDAQVRWLATPWTADIRSSLMELEPLALRRALEASA